MKMKNMQLPILAGILIGTSYIPFPPWAIFFGFVPLWMAWLRATSIKQVWWQGWVAQFIFTLIGFNWVAHTIYEFGHLPWIFSAICLIGFCSFANLQVPIAGVTWFLLTRSKRVTLWQKLLLLPGLMAIFEWTFPMIFDWHFGYTWLYARFPAMQLADIVGMKGLSHFSIFANLFFLIAASAAWTKAQRIGSVVSFAVVFGALNIAGAWWVERLPAEDGHLKVGIVQANIGNLEKQYAESGLGFRDVIVRKYTDMTRALAHESGKMDFVVWPETAFPDVLKSGRFQNAYAAELTRLAQETQTNLAIGAYGVERDGRMSNSFFIVNTSGEVQSPSYPKTMLLAFGEYFPGANLLPKLREWFPEVGDFARGPGPTVLSLGALRLGVQICYEGLFDWFTTGLAKAGAQVLINVTNDSWFGTWEEPYQHMYMTLSRALEVRRPLVRSTNTGISTVISARGDIDTFSPLHREWSHVYDVPYFTSPSVTVFQRFGYILEPLFLVLWVLGIFALRFFEKETTT